MSKSYWVLYKLCRRSLNFIFKNKEEINLSNINEYGSFHKQKQINSQDILRRKANFKFSSGYANFRVKLGLPLML